MEAFEPRTLLLFGGVAIGLIFGVVGRLSGFCLRSAIVEAVDGRAGRQVAAWATALAVAVAGTQGLIFAGIVDLSESVYLGSSIAPLALVAGGLLFGVGMVLTRGCGGRHLVLAAGGNLRSWVVLVVLGLTAYATLRGVLALVRVSAESLATVDVSNTGAGLAAILGAASGLDSQVFSVAAVVILAAVAGVAVLRIARSAGLKAGGTGLVSGLAVGLLIPAAWYVTGVLGFDEFDPTAPESLTFTAPVGNAIQYLMTYTGSQATFGVAVIGGVLLGAFMTAAATRSLRPEGFETPGHLARYALGAALMGFGGVMALGCTIGAGLSGVSTLSGASMIALASIIVGGAVGHRIKTQAFGEPTPAMVPAE